MYFNTLPASLQEKNKKFLRWQDRYSHLFGKVLLADALKRFGYGALSLDHLSYTKYGRPALSPDIDFNISHSGEYVVCVIGEHIRLGIDIEKIRAVNFENFSQEMSPQEWSSILKSENQFKDFFTYWTIKESVIKADGRGLSIPLNEIKIQGNIACCDRKQWCLYDLPIDKNYCASLAANIEIGNCKVEFIDYFTEVLEKSPDQPTNKI